ncbi:hypothetical protein GGR50DRAFT_318004 [Xylaria sp. CBS 124048]|nr:hypothetical protein GGR50DRAFT_318004 [Xylaria sp. CBS 124048]
MHARPFYLHPYAQTRGSHSTSSQEQRRRLTPESTSRMNHPDVTVKRGPSDPAVARMMADMKLSLAANQLSEQVKESMGFWRKFQSEYSADVNSIKLYAGGDVLQKIWRKKVEHSRKRKGGDKDDDQRFDIQSMKLESCLNQVDEATQLLAEAWSSGHSSDYDSRHHYLEKLRRTGDFAISLSKESRSKEIACRDLLDELAELEKLLDPKTSTNMLHRFNKRQAQKSTRSGESRHDGHSSDRSEHENADKLEHNSSDWPGDGEQDSPSWENND